MMDLEEPTDERTDRIIQVAMELAEKDGFDAVRLRDLAAKAEVALGTVYRRFSCKEDILAAALDRQVSAMHQVIVGGGMFPGNTPEQRLHGLFEQVTDVMAERPKLAAAMLRTVASGVPELAERVMRYHGKMTEIILHVYRGGIPNDEFPSEDELIIARLLQNIWFGALVGWTGGMHGVDTVIAQVDVATRLLVKALNTPNSSAPGEQ